MRRSEIALGCCLALTVVRCGGSPPVAQTAGQPPMESAGAAAEPIPGPEPPASQELAAGVKAFDAANYADARSAFEAASKKNPGNYQALYDLGMTCEKLGDKPAAEAAYKAALAAKPDLEAAAAGLSALYVDEGRLDEALAIARTALAKHPGSAALHENMGVALAARGDQDNALKELSQAVQITPTDAMLHLQVAHWLNVWKVRGATPHLDAARDLVKDDYGMIASIAYEYRMASEFDSCVKTYDRAVAIKDGGEVRLGRALCKLGLKDEKGTLDDLQAAVAKEPSYAPAHYYLGGRLALAKHFKEAAAEYGKYLQLEPNGSLAAKATEKQKLAQDAMKTKGGKK
ncbi:MAG: tetratricopeptide repeat protein [Polyangiaceae bacterium]|jgi:tetratricopeptide (TPR) repeat protein